MVGGKSKESVGSRTDFLMCSKKGKYFLYQRSRFLDQADSHTIFRGTANVVMADGAKKLFNVFVLPTETLWWGWYSDWLSSCPVSFLGCISCVSHHPQLEKNKRSQEPSRQKLPDADQVSVLHWRERDAYLRYNSSPHPGVNNWYLVPFGYLCWN